MPHSHCYFDLFHRSWDLRFKGKIEVGAMDERVVLKSHSDNGHPLEAIFLPAQGMNLISFKKGDVEIIDQTPPLIQGIVGPYYGQRIAQIIPHCKEEPYVQHAKKMELLGYHDPFAYGIARYASWRYSSTENSLSASLNDKDLWNGISLKTLVGQAFEMHISVNIHSKGLKFLFSIVSDSDSLVGMQYFFQLPEKKGKIQSKIQDTYLSSEGHSQVPLALTPNEKNFLEYAFEKPIQMAFFPFHDPLQGKIQLETRNYQLMSSYICNCQENAWVLDYSSSSYVSFLSC